MEGAVLAATRMHERQLLVAHQGAAWTGAAYAGKLKPFSHYKKQDKEPAQSSDQVLSAMMALQDLGAPMKIELVN